MWPLFLFIFNVPTYSVFINFAVTPLHTHCGYFWIQKHWQLSKGSIYRPDISRQTFQFLIVGKSRSFLLFSCLAGVLKAQLCFQWIPVSNLSVHRAVLCCRLVHLLFTQARHQSHLSYLDNVVWHLWAIRNMVYKDGCRNTLYFTWSCDNVILTSFSMSGAMQEDQQAVLELMDQG